LGAEGFMEESKIFYMPISAEGDQYSREEDKLIVQLKEATFMVTYCGTSSNKNKRNSSSTILHYSKG
jgi:hypothetical protein